MAILEELNKINGVVSPSIMEAIAILKKGGIISKKVTVLPEVGEAGVLYFAPKDGATAPDVYGEYLYVDGAWELLGTAGGGDATDAVKYTEQTLTEEQQMQARKNLDLYRSEIETTQLIPEATVHYDSITNPPLFLLDSLPEEGQIVRCTFNGTNYVTPVVIVAGAILAIGNPRIADPDLPDTGEPFFGMFGTQSEIGSGMNLLLPEGTEDVDVTFGADLLNETIHKVPEEYLPNEIATKDYVDDAIAPTATKDYVKGVVTGSETRGAMIPSVERYPYTDYYAVCYDETDGTMYKFPIDCVGTRDVKQHNRNVPQWYGNNCLYTDVGEPGVDSFEIDLFPTYPDSPVEHSVRASFVFRPSGTNFSISIRYLAEGLSDYVYWEDGHAPSDMTWDNQCIYRIDAEVFPDPTSGNAYAMCKITKLNHVSVEPEAN